MIAINYLFKCPQAPPIQKLAAPKNILKIFQLLLMTNKILKEQYLNTLI